MVYLVGRPAASYSRYERDFAGAPLCGALVRQSASSSIKDILDLRCSLYKLTSLLLEISC
jgi:hypothetical protein